MSIYDEQRDKIKKQIFDTAINLYRNNGYEQTKINEITKSVGIAKGTFYNYYLSKLDILLIWSKSIFESLDLSSCLNQNNDFRTNFNNFLKIMTEKIKDEEELYLSFLQEILKLQMDKELKANFNMKAIIDLIIDNSKDKALMYINRELKINILNNSMFLEIIHWFNDKNTTTGLENHLMKLVDICLDGMYNK